MFEFWMTRGLVGDAGLDGMFSALLREVGCGEGEFRTFEELYGVAACTSIWSIILKVHNLDAADLRFQSRPLRELFTVPSTDNWDNWVDKIKFSSFRNTTCKTRLIWLKIEYLKPDKSDIPDTTPDVSPPRT
jgi:hypothetical protein